MPESDDAVTIPPEIKRNREFHWLTVKGAPSFFCALWLKGQWYSPGEAGPISPAEMYRRGWRWAAVAKWPRRLGKRE